MVLEALMRLFVTKRNSFVEFFLPRKGSKIGFVEFIERFGHHYYFFSVWSILKVYIICYIPVQVPHLGKM